MSNLNVGPHRAGNSASLGFGRLGQQILNLLEHAGARAAERRNLRALDRRELEDCGMTPADVAPEMPDLFANDFRVVPYVERHAA